MIANPTEYPDLLDLRSEREAEAKDFDLVTRRMELPLILVGQDEELSVGHGRLEVSIRHTSGGPRWAYGLMGIGFRGEV